MTLRPYQERAVRAILGGFVEGKRPLVCLPTGSGKSHVIADVCLSARANKKKVLIIGPNKEIAAQNASKLSRFGKVGLLSASFGKKEVRPVTVGTIGTIVNHLDDIRETDVVLIDECHLVQQNGEGMYNQVLDSLPNAYVGGFTATPYRLSSGVVYGKGKVFCELAYEAVFADLVAEGYLSPVVNKQNPSLQYDTSAVKIRGWDFVSSELSELGRDTKKTRAIVNDALSWSWDRGSRLWFCLSVEHANQVGEMLLAPVITAETKKDYRDVVLANFREGLTRDVVNCDVLTTGFDAPRTDCIILMRSTMSPGLYVQMVGRGTRLFEGKEDCLLLDYGGNISRHGPMSTISASSGRERGGKGARGEPFKACPSCFEVVGLNTVTCESCGYQWPEREVLESRIDQLLDSPDDGVFDLPAWVDIDDIDFSVHQKGKDDMTVSRTMRVDYYRKGRRVASEWVCLEHEGFAKRKADKWWRQKVDGAPPNNIEEAIDKLRRLAWMPREIFIEMDGKWKRVKEVR